MTNPAAFKGTYSDFRVIKGRQVAQFVIEVPIEQADAALRVLGGLPRPSAEPWVAVAPIDPEAAEQKAKPEKVPFDKKPLSVQCALRCEDPRFREWIDPFSVGDVPSAADVVRAHLGIRSRSELDTDPAAAERWKKMDAQYLEETGQMAVAR